MRTTCIWLRLHFYRIKKYISLFVKSAEDLLFFLVITIMKINFEAAVISAVNEVCQISVITGCNFHFIQCLWRQIKNIVLPGEYK